MSPPKSSASTTRRRRQPPWTKLPDDELLDLRFCDLGLTIESTPLLGRVEALYEQLERRDIRLRPHCWLSDEWFSPDQVPGIAIPFYLAHPRLQRLERRMMLDVEGGTTPWCMQILRHEAGHCVDTAFRLHRRKRWQKVFGHSTEPYPDNYRPRPYSKAYVQHLDSWYAQSHPSEDFAETFAVWLNPGSRWRQRYKGWPALKKLDYVDDLMGEIAGQRPAITSRKRVGRLSELRKTLRLHYQERQRRYGVDEPELLDNDLHKLFTSSRGTGKRESALGFLRRSRTELRRTVSKWTGENPYTVDQVLQEMIARCRHLKLYRSNSQRQTMHDAALLLAVHTMKYLLAGQPERSL